MLSDRAQRRIDGLLDQAESVASANNGETMPFWKMGTSGKFLVWTVLVFALAIVGVGCGSSDGEDTVSDETKGGALSSTQPSTIATPAPDREKIEISWLKEGNFWMLSWSELESNVTWTERGGTFDTGSFTLKLGPRQDISGYEMYEVILNGDVGEYSPGWDFIGTDTYGGVYGLVDGIEGAVLLYSVIDSGVPRTGFYAKFAPGKMITTNRNSRIIPSQFTNQVPHFEGNITGVGYSGGGRQVFEGTGCDYYPGVGTICGGGTTLGPSQDETHIEYWSADAGPVGMHYSYNFEDCLGTACNEKHIERRIEARYFGDFAGSSVGYENEPDTYADPTPIDVEGPIFTIMGEINEFDTPSGFIEGIEAPVGMALAAEIQDWYRFEVTAVEQDRVRDFYVLWNGPDVDLDVYLYSAPDNQPFGLLYLAEGEVLDDTLQFERGKFLSGSLAPGSYLIGVHLPNADQGPVPYGVISVRE